MLYSSKDLFGMAKLGYAKLPHIGIYREGIAGDEAIEIADDELAQYSVSTRKYYYRKLKRKTWYNTLSRKGVERFKKDLWNHFDHYQNNNEPRYMDTKESKKKKKLTEGQFYSILLSEIDDIDINTLRELFYIKKKMEVLEQMVKHHKLDFESFSKEMEERYEKPESQETQENKEVQR